MKNTLKRYGAIIAIITLFSLSLNSVALAGGFEIKYPTLPGTDPLNANDPDLLIKYIRYIFVLSFTIAGIIGVISLAIGGVQILLAAGNPSAISDARDRLFSAVLGIILLLLAFVILTTINPQLALLRFPNVGVAPGAVIVARRAVAFENQSNPLAIKNANAQAPADSFSETYRILGSAPENIITDDWIAQGGELLVFICSNTTGDVTPPWIIETYATEKFEYEDAEFEELSIEAPLEDPTADTKIIPCESFNGDINSAAFGRVSIRLADYESIHQRTFEDGIYLFPESGCEGAATGPLTISGYLPKNLQYRVKSALIKNGNGPNDPKWGFILTNDITQENIEISQGSCTQPFLNRDSSKAVQDPTNMGQCFEIASCQNTSPPPPSPAPSPAPAP